MSDAVKRDLGARSALALEGLMATVWKLSVEVIEAAEVDYRNRELTPERAYHHLASLLEQRRLLKQLEAQVDEGLRAGQRVVRTQEQSVLQQEAARAAALTGRNRFMPGTRVPPMAAASGVDSPGGSGRI